MCPTAPVLRRWLASDALHPADFETLATELDRDCLRAWNIRPEAIAEHLHARAQDFKALYPHLRLAGDFLGMAGSDRFFQVAWNLWLPLARKIASRAQQQERPLVWGMLGLQGTGKTTLAFVLHGILNAWGYSVLSLSIDDLYKTYHERCELQQADPRLIWRGPPGTHDVDLGIELLDNICARRVPLEIPRFDKSYFSGAGDRTIPQILDATVDIVLFEGWFIGARPVPEASFDRAPLPIATEADRQFARDCNARLAAYLPLWDRLDALMVLYPDDFRDSLYWRQESEAQARALGKGGMSHHEVVKFVDYFWRALHPELFVKPLLTDPARVDLAVALSPRRVPLRIYAPE